MSRLLSCLVPAILGFAGGACSNMLFTSSPLVASDKSEKEPIIHKKLRTHHLEIVSPHSNELVGRIEALPTGIVMEFLTPDSALKDPETGERNERRRKRLRVVCNYESGPAVFLDQDMQSSELYPGAFHISGTYEYKGGGRQDRIAYVDVSPWGASWKDRDGPTILWFDAGYGEDKTANLTMGSDGHKDKLVIKVPRDRDKSAELSFLDKDGKVIETYPKK